MDKELTIQDLEAQADALLAAADEMEELLPADTGIGANAPSASIGMQPWYKRLPLQQR